MQLGQDQLLQGYIIAESRASTMGVTAHSRKMARRNDKMHDNVTQLVQFMIALGIGHT